MDKKPSLFKRMALKIGAYAVKYAGGVTFDSVSASWYLRNGYPQIYSILTGGSPAWSGETVSLDSALNHSVVWACNKIISESIGFIPAILMREQPDGDVYPDRKHPMYNAMRRAPNEEISAQVLTETMTSHGVMAGNGYSHIRRRSGTGTAIGLDMLLPQNVNVDRDSSKRLVYVVKSQGEADRTFTVAPGKPHDILHLRGLGWDGMRGYSVITMARQSIGAAIAAERNVSRFWANGGRSPYYLKLAQKFKTEEEYQKFRSDWESTYSEPNKAPILEPWLEYKDIGMNMRDAQMLESRQFSIPEICRWFSVYPHMVGDLSRATFNNIEHLFLQFLQMTLSTWITRWEQEFWRCVLTDDEKSQGYILRHDVDELLRGDFKTRMDGYASALQNGHLNIDEVRGREKRNKLPNGAGQHYHIQLNMQDVENVGDESQTNPESGDGAKKWLKRIA